ncbi:MULTISPECIES: hypothetical protein [unclassified Pseudoalteromonas]|uniref:hypothetical protein n=1 Tax=Pseudoalteromonas sp. RB2-MNA-CIBAN-0110 TaxID=3140439 RepID=UPI00040E616E|nr:hypothetical protein [Pseudoalteromonas sp. TB13]
MSIDDIFKISGAIIASVGGSALLIAGFSTWLGKVWANRILEKDKLKYTSELEAIKSELQRESERQKVTFSLYFEGQFKLYNELWIALSELQNEVDKLWESASNENLKSFIKAVQKAKKQIRNSAILIEKTHYEKILQNLNSFENYKFGKERLIVSRNISNLASYEIDEIVRQNQQFRTEITEFTQFMLEHMRNQIKGS